MSQMDDNLAAVIARIPGVTVTHHYRGDEQSASYYVHCKVEDAIALHRLCQMAERANAPLQIYEHSDTEFRYTLVLNDYSRGILMSQG